MERRFSRPQKERLLLGVCAGLGQYFGIETLWIRVIAILITVVSGFFPGLAAYFVLAYIMPKEGSGPVKTESTFKENLADLQESSQNLTKAFKNAFSENPGQTGSQTENAPPKSVSRQTDKRKGVYVIAIVLVALGIFFIIVNNVGWLQSYIWPLTLITVGFIVVAVVLTRRKE
jgi:phage shock protein PspC (stress-responsive transcriptional regulator)